MTMTPFTPEGVSSKMTELYALDEQELLAEARAVGMDFRAWFQKHFILRPSQIKYLEEASSSFLLFWGYVFGTAFIGRRPITMVKLPHAPRFNKEDENSLSSIFASYSPEKNIFPAEITFRGEVTIVFVED